MQKKKGTRYTTIAKSHAQNCWFCICLAASIAALPRTLDKSIALISSRAGIASQAHVSQTQHSFCLFNYWLCVCFIHARKPEPCEFMQEASLAWSVATPLKFVSDDAAKQVLGFFFSTMPDDQKLIHHDSD